MRSKALFTLDNMVKSHCEKKWRHWTCPRFANEPSYMGTSLFCELLLSNWGRVWGRQSEGRMFYFLTGHMSIGKILQEYLGCFNWIGKALQGSTLLQGQKWLHEDSQPQGKLPHEKMCVDLHEFTTVLLCRS